MTDSLNTRCSLSCARGSILYGRCRKHTEQSKSHDEQSTRTVPSRDKDGKNELNRIPLSGSDSTQLQTFQLDTTESDKFNGNLRHARPIRHFNDIIADLNDDDARRRDDRFAGLRDQLRDLADAHGCRLEYGEGVDDVDDVAAVDGVNDVDDRVLHFDRDGDISNVSLVRAFVSDIFVKIKN